MRRGGGQNNNNSSGQRSAGRGGHYYSEAPPAFARPPPPPFASPSARPPLPPPPPPPPPPVPDYHLYIKPEKVPIETLPFVYDPYGGIPRREDLDPYNTSMPLPRPTHDNDLQPTFRSFRDVILSMQSWGVRYPEPTDTSIKRWARRALRADARAQALREQQLAGAPPPAATSSPLHGEAQEEEEEENVSEDGASDGECASPENPTTASTATAGSPPNVAAQTQKRPPTAPQ